MLRSPNGRDVDCGLAAVERPRLLACRHLEGGFNLQRFERAVTKLTGIKLRKPIMEIFFWTLDLDDSGALHWLEVEKIMHSRSTGAYGDVSNDRASLMECMRNCVKNVRAA